MKTFLIILSVVAVCVTLLYLGLQWSPGWTMIITFCIIPGTIFSSLTVAQAYYSERGLTWRLIPFSLASFFILPAGALGAFAPVGHKQYAKNDKELQSGFLRFQAWAAGEV